MCHKIHNTTYRHKQIQNTYLKKGIKFNSICELHLPWSLLHSLRVIPSSSHPSSPHPPFTLQSHEYISNSSQCVCGGNSPQSWEFRSGNSISHLRGMCRHTDDAIAYLFIFPATCSLRPPLPPPPLGFTEVDALHRSCMLSLFLHHNGRPSREEEC